jgi:hypothetical protein
VIHKFRSWTTLVTLLGGYAGTITGIASIEVLGSTRPVFYLLATFLVAIALVLEIQALQESKPFFKGREEDSHGAMTKLLQKNGRAVIFTVELSFARDNPTAMDALLRKAEHGELTLCIPHMVPQAEVAARHGADVHVYADASWVPTSRFTVVRYHQHDSEIYFGHHVSPGVFVIECFRYGSVPHVLAEDLARLTIQRFARDGGPSIQP